MVCFGSVDVLCGISSCGVICLALVLLDCSVYIGLVWNCFVLLVALFGVCVMIWWFPGVFVVNSVAWLVLYVI